MCPHIRTCASSICCAMPGVRIRRCAVSRDCLAASGLAFK